MIGALPMPDTLWIGVAWVGFGFAACTQPKDAHEPHEMIAIVLRCFQELIRDVMNSGGRRVRLCEGAADLSTLRGCR